MTPFRVLGVLNGGIRWADVQDGQVSLDRLAEARGGSLSMQRGLDPQDAPDPEDVDFRCRPAEEPLEHEERDAA